MIQVTTGSKWTLSDLASFYEPVEIRDGQGKLLGLFVPANLERCDQLYARTASPHDRAEIDRRLRDEAGKGVTYKEVLLKFLSRTTNPEERRELQNLLDAWEAEERCASR